MSAKLAVFMHIPKTGGNCIFKSLQAQVYATGHGPLQYAIDRTIPKLRNTGLTWDTIYKFSFIRNPWDRMVSWYYHSAPQKRDDWCRTEHINGFRDWFCYRGLQSLMKTVPERALTTWDGQIVPDFIGQYEHLERDLLVVADALNTTVPVIKLANPGANRPEWARDFRQFYDTRTDSMIVATADWEIATFKYTRDDEPTPMPVERPAVTVG